MHKKNIIFITLDEFTYNVMNKEFKNGLNTTPFLNELSKKSITTTKMYSQGPYTEMAIRGLLYGEDGLDSLDTMFTRPSHDYTFYKKMKECGYTTEIITDFLYQTTADDSVLYSQLHKNDSWKALCSTRLSEFEPAILSNMAAPHEIKICYELLELKFTNMISLYEKLNTNDFSVSYFKKNYIQCAEHNLKMYEFYKNEMLKLNADAEKYILSFFKEKLHEKFDELDNFTVVQYIKDDDLREYSIKQHGVFTKRLKQKNFILNLKNTRIPLSNIRYNFILTLKTKSGQGFKNFKSLMIHYANLLTDKYICQHKRNDIIGDLTISVGMFKSFFEFIEQKTDNSPFFCYMQPTDIHVPADIFNVHSKNKSDIDREYEIANDFINNSPDNFSGSLNYYTTARILDERLKLFVEELEERHLLDDSYLIITGDHGTSCLYDKVRETMDNTSYDTQYHVPFILYGKDIEPRSVDKLTYSKDIAPTLFSLLGLEVQENFSGHNILDDFDYNPYIIHEYMGGGCPNFHKKPARFFIRDLEYKVSYSVMLNGKFEDGAITEIHDLVKDPFETNNLIYSKYNKDKVAKMLIALKERYNEIQKQF